MKLKAVTLQLLAGAAALSTVAAAEPLAPKIEGPTLKPVPAERKVDLEALFAMADLNKDGVITKAEFRKAYTQLERTVLAAQPRPIRPHPAKDPCKGCGRG